MLSQLLSLADSVGLTASLHTGFPDAASASGMSFVDSEVPALLTEPLDALLFTCVGVPEYTAAPGGPPR